MLYRRRRGLEHRKHTALYQNQAKPTLRRKLVPEPQLRGNVRVMLPSAGKTRHRHNSSKS